MTCPREPLNDEEKRLLEERRKARQNKDFKASDSLREELRKKGLLWKTQKMNNPTEG